MAILKDEDWVRQSFMIPQYAFEEEESIQRALSDACYKFTDTTLGGNFAINPPPQFCKYTDIRVKGRFAVSEGMGRYYSEALDDHGQFIHLRFGVPTFNSLTNFYTGFYNDFAATLANRGRTVSAFYKFVYATSFVVGLPIHIALWFGKVIRFFNNKPTSRYYYLKPAMPLYWSAVANIVNAIGVNMGVIGENMSAAEAKMRNGEEVNSSPNEANEIQKKTAEGMANSPYNIYREDGGVDVFALATKYRRLSHKNRMNFNKAMGESSSWEQLQGNMREFSKDPLADDGVKRTLKDALELYHNPANTTTNPTTSTAAPAAGGKPDLVNESAGNFFESLSLEAFADYAQAELEDGSAFVTFRVDNVQTVGESFRSSSTESQIAGMINSMSSTGRTSRFTWAGGNVGDDPLSAIGEVFVGGALDLAKAALTGLGVGGLIALSGTAFVDIPKVWQSSSADLPTASYTIELRSPYGTPLARFQNLVIPLAMILAGALPLSTGKQSYTSPFLCELYCKGRNQIRLGMIESLSITRGSGNLGWTADGEPLGIDVTFTVTDLSGIMHMPIAPNFDAVDAVVKAVASVAGEAASEAVDTLAASNFDDDNAFSDYMAVLASLGLEDQIYPQNKLRLNKARRQAGWQQWKSPARIANWALGNHPAWLPRLLAWIDPADFATNNKNR